MPSLKNRRKQSFSLYLTQEERTRIEKTKPSRKSMCEWVRDLIDIGLSKIEESIGKKQ